MATEHTSGPWIVVDGTTTGKAVIAPNEPKVRKNVAMVGGQNREGNAYLIAAAPDLLDALKTLWKAVDAGVDTNTDLWTDAALKYRAAIAKAEGRS